MTDSPIISLSASPKPKTPTALSINCAAERTVGENVDVWGDLDAPIGPFGVWQGITGKTVKLTIRKPDGTVTERTTVTFVTGVAAYGRYSFTILIDQAGVWQFQAHFAGDESYQGCEADGNLTLAQLVQLGVL